MWWKPYKVPVPCAKKHEFMDMEEGGCLRRLWHPFGGSLGDGVFFFGCLFQKGDAWLWLWLVVDMKFMVQTCPEQSQMRSTCRCFGGNKSTLITQKRQAWNTYPPSKVPGKIKFSGASSTIAGFPTLFDSHWFDHV